MLKLTIKEARALSKDFENIWNELLQQENDSPRVTGWGKLFDIYINSELQAAEAELKKIDGGF